MPPTHITHTLFLGIDDASTKEALWNLFDSLALELMLRTQNAKQHQGDEGQDFWTRLHVDYPKVLLVTAVTTDKAQIGIFVSSDAVEQLFTAVRAESLDAPSGYLTRFLIDHPHVPVLQATAMFISVTAIIEISKDKENPLTPFPSALST